MFAALALTAVLLAPTADAARNVCGDDRARAGEACDGMDLGGETCTSQGFAGGGTLACASDCTFDTSACDAGGGDTGGSAVCGDGMAEGIEECDGMDDSACPGLCSDACACPATGTGDLEVHVIDVG
jgi:hypothetical protein